LREATSTHSDSLACAGTRFDLDGNDEIVFYNGYGADDVGVSAGDEAGMGMVSIDAMTEQCVPDRGCWSNWLRTSAGNRCSSATRSSWG
jgi:hypothetical protein